MMKLLPFALLLSFDACALGFEMFDGNEQKPPDIKPFELPTLTGEPVDYNGHINPLEPVPLLDSDAIFQEANDCYPEETKFKGEVNLEAGIKTNDVITEDNTRIGREYIGIVARMPLYSPIEKNREREREYMRRTRTADLIGAFITAIAERNHARREISLYRLLESRSQVRVQKGLVSIPEQVGYMEKLLASNKLLIQSEALITSSRLSIVAQCADEKRRLLNNWLKRMAELPMLEKKS